MGLNRLATLLFGAVGLARADVYMQYPPGSNNRLDEGGGNRNNNNRLMDTQNNGKGGYGYGGSADNKAEPLSYMVGSQLSMSWTAQHSCGSENAECQMVVQYMCNDNEDGPPAGVRVDPDANNVGEGPIRDGTDGTSPDEDNPDEDRGLHEPSSFYKDCNTRNRNAGLYTADQNVNGNDATRTRQNPNGAQSGLECPEERDYYPYWHPSPWKDLAIMTNNMALCEYYAAQSQNVVAKNYCTETAENNEADCTAAGGTWEEIAAFGIDAPDCISAPWTRDNHLGNPGGIGNEMTLNLTIPFGAGSVGRRLSEGVADDNADNCVLRLRYNITTSDTRACEDNTFTTKATCEAAGFIWSAAFVDASYNDQEDEQFLASDDSDPEGGVKLPQQNPTVDMGGFLLDADADDGDDTDSYLELAINTNQYGRTFQDRTHVFSIQERPASVASNSKIFNLNVRGKRGNIVQAYPAVEYDFHPPELVVGLNDFVHIQWTGNDNTNNNGNNNGEGTDDEDRHNIVQIKESGLDIPATPEAARRRRRLSEDDGSVVDKDMFDVTFEWNPDTSSTFSGSRDQAELTKQFALVKQDNCLADDDIDGDQQAQNCQKLNAAAATVDLGMLRFKSGAYKYMSSRNNNFSNRAQKAKLTVLDTSSVPPLAPVNVQATAMENSGNEESAIVKLTWEPYGGEPYVGTDGKTYTGRSEALKQSAAYFVQLSYDGGVEWWNYEGCWPVTGSQGTECTIEGLMAGTTYNFRVYAGASGSTMPSTGVGTMESRRLSESYELPASETVSVQTEHSSTSESCQKTLYDEANGISNLSSGAIAGIVLGVFAGIGIIVLAFFLLRRRAPPPPPPMAMPQAEMAKPM
jgi:hypothetical protein